MALLCGTLPLYTRASRAGMDKEMMIGGITLDNASVHFTITGS
jgi:hypothetical protein